MHTILVYTQLSLEATVTVVHFQNKQIQFSEQAAYV